MTFDFEISSVFRWNFESVKPIVINQGGTSSGKTYSILQVLICKCLQEKNQVVTVVGQDVPNLKSGAIRDFETIIETTPFFSRFLESINRTDKSYKFINGSIIEFKSYENEQDAKSGKRQYLFVNEANGVPFSVYDQLQIRTEKQVFLDYNPTFAFWVHDKLIGRDDVDLFISNYKNNPFISAEIIRKIEQLKHTDPNKWKVYGLGKTGVLENGKQKHKSDEAISLFFTIRQYPSETEKFDSLKSFEHQCRVAEELMSEKIVPNFVLPLTSVIAQKRIT